MKRQVGSQKAIVKLSFFYHSTATSCKEGMNVHVFNFNLIFHLNLNLIKLKYDVMSDDTWSIYMSHLIRHGITCSLSTCQVNGHINC